MIRNPICKLLLAVSVLAGANCQTLFPVVPGGAGTPPDGIDPSRTIGSDFASATPLELDADGNATLSGTLSAGKVDVYDLGPVNPGDRVIVAVRPAAGSPLDPTTAVFNAGGDVFILSDDVDLAANRLDSFIDDVVAEASDPFYLAITKFHFDTQGGDYEGTVGIERGGAIPQRPVQVLLLNFGGGTVSVPSEPTLTLDPFDAADIDSDYDGATASIKAKVVEIVRENFRSTGLQVITNDDPLPADGRYSTIFLGGFSATKFGVAQAVDGGNRDCCDDGIVFTDDFDKPFFPKPSVEGIGIAIGNVAAHEAGHLLGLNHVDDVTALMDTTGSASTLLIDQEFKRAPLSATVFPFGMQNAPAYLARIIPP